METSGLTAEEMRDYVERDAKLMQEVIEENKSEIDKYSLLGEDRVNAPSLGEVGEIWVSTFGNSSGSLAVVGHAAIVSERPEVTIEAYPDFNSPIGKDGVQEYPNTWKNRGGGKILLGNKVSSPEKRQGAAAWAKSKVGTSYWINVHNKYDISRMYCSQLVWYAWLTQGNDIDYIKWDAIVTPAEIVKSPATTILWGTLG
ncbi:hypothetical protein [Mobiluncus mulieris]|uniref:hypothetical protein n=1 Tax=Mobiluncus mulieris TaxID=2052 RepID=UPI002015F619|nr:hypothetical protein [Mobiluncus mulieris]